jgi:hypothetical protein
MQDTMVLQIAKAQMLEKVNHVATAPAEAAEAAVAKDLVEDVNQFRVLLLPLLLV